MVRNSQEFVSFFIRQVLLYLEVDLASSRIPEIAFVNFPKYFEYHKIPTISGI
ncbi:hypothetical protein LPICM17_660113 [Lactococcus piscium]|nr:hypothetical protein LPICM17_660113 [Lactococcus piscium]